MKIALIDPSLFTWPYDSALGLALQANGHAVTVFGKCLAQGAAPDGPLPLRQLFYPGFERERMQSLPHPVFLALKGLSHPLSLIRLLAALKAMKPDVIHFQWTPLPVIDRMFIGLFRRIAPVVLTVHDSAPFNNNPRSQLQRLSAIAIMRRFDRLIVHTEQARARLVTYGVHPERIQRIAHGVLEAEITGISPPPARADNSVNVLLFGKLKPYKGADILIRALALMPESARARCRLRIVGKPYMDTGPLFALARALNVDKHIAWDLRFIDDAGIAGIFSDADILAMPYREIDASGVLMAALAAGRPIVASRIGLFSEMLEDGKHGYLVPTEDPQALADALARLADDAPLRRAMGAQVRALREAIPGWSAIAEETETLYREAVHARAQAQ